MIIFIFSLCLFLVFSFVGFQNLEFYQTFISNKDNILCLVYFFFNYIVTPLYTTVVNVYGLVFTFHYTPFSLWIYFLLVYLIGFTYLKTSRSLVTTLYLFFSLGLSYLWGFLVLHEDLAFSLLGLTLIILCFGLFLLYLYNKKNTEAYLLEINSSPHVSTKFSNLVEAFTKIPVPVSTVDRLQRLAYYDLIFGFMSLMGFVKSNFLMTIVLSRYLLNPSNFYSVLAGILWISVSLALLVFDSHWSKDFKVHNGEKVLYLLGYNNIYKNLYNTLIIVITSSFAISLSGLVNLSHCSPGSTPPPEKIVHQVTHDFLSNQSTVLVQYGECNRLMTQRFTSIVQATEISNQVIASFQQDSTCWPPRLKVSEPGLAVRMAEGLGRGAATGAAQIVKK